MRKIRARVRRTLPMVMPTMSPARVGVDIVVPLGWDCGGGVCVCSGGVGPSDVFIVVEVVSNLEVVVRKVEVVLDVVELTLKNNGDKHTGSEPLTKSLRSQIYSSGQHALTLGGHENRPW